MPIGLITHMDTTRPEDVNPLITNLDYMSTPFTSAIGEATALNTLHEWQVDNFSSPAHNAGIEGADVTVADLTQPTRTTNVVQLFQKTVTVSDTESAIPHYGMGDPFVYQTDKKMTELKRDIELAAIQGTRASGSSGVGRQMDGAIALITTNKTARTSGTSFTYSEFTQIMKSIFDSGTDSYADLVLLPSYLQLVADSFTTKVNQDATASAGVEGFATDVIVTSFGRHRVALSRQIPTSGVLAVDTSKWAKAYLINRGPQMRALGKTGSSTKGLIEAEVTLVALNQKSSAYRSGYFIG